MEEELNCPCSGTFEEIGGIGKHIQVSHGEFEGIVELVLYQCPSCKAVSLKT